MLLLFVSMTAAHIHSYDTDPETEAFRLRLIASLDPQERFERMNRLCAFGKSAMLEGLRDLHPEWSERELVLTLAKNLWGAAFAEHIARKLDRDSE